MFYFIFPLNINKPSLNLIRFHIKCASRRCGLVFSWVPGWWRDVSRFRIRPSFFALTLPAWRLMLWLRSGQRLREAAVVSWKPSWFNLEVGASRLIVISSCHCPPTPQKKLYGHLISYYDCGFMCPRQSVSSGFWLMTTNLKRSRVKLICFSNLYGSSGFKRAHLDSSPELLFILDAEKWMVFWNCKISPTLGRQSTRHDEKMMIFYFWATSEPKKDV